MTSESFELFADVFPEPMLLVSPAGRVMAANEALRQMAGANPEKGREAEVSDLFTTPPEQIRAYLKLCSGVRQFIPGSLKLRSGSGTELDLRCEGAAIGGPEPAERQIVLRLREKQTAISRFRWLNEQVEQLNHEIRERIEVEEQRKIAEHRLEESFLRERDAREVAEKANRAKDDFLASLSHELRTPLNPALLIASDAAENADYPPAVRQSFETIRKNIEMEARLIDDLLDLTSIIHGKMALHPRVTDVQKILREAIVNIQSDAHRKQIEIERAGAPAPALVYADEVRLQQVFGNVLKNAVKFTPARGKIIVGTSTVEGQLRVTVSDTGIGLTPEEIERVFGAFTQGDHVGGEAHRFGGLGLGLAISRQLVEMHGGRISAESPGRNQGATFVIELPLAPPSAVAPPARDHSPGGGASKPAAGASTAILLVEDHEPTRSALAQLLKRRHYRVHIAGTAAEARALAAREKIDLVISDIGLPDGSGNDLMLELRGRLGLKGIALTGYGMEQDVEKSLASGFVTHLIKPVNMAALENALALFVA